MIEVRQLRYFTTLAEHLHFGRASDVLHVAQSALSTQIMRLEQDLGVALLNRRKRANVSLTEAGELFLVEALQSLRQLERTERLGRLAARGAVGRIELGYVASAVVSGALPRLLRPFRQTQPLVEVALFPMDTPTQLKGLTDGTIDLGILRPRLNYPDDIATRPLHQEPVIIAMTAGTELASRDKIWAADLGDERFIIPQLGDEDEGFWAYLRQLGRLAGTEIEPTVKVADFISALSLTASGYGVVLLPKSFDRVRIDGVVFREIADFNVTISLTLAWRAKLVSPAVRSFLDLVGQPSG